MRRLERRVEHGDAAKRTAGGRYFEETGAELRGKQNHAVARPRSSTRGIHRIRQRDDRALRQIESLEFGRTEEANRLAVGRPEWIAGFVGALQRARGHVVETAQPQTLARSAADRGEHQHRPVGRECRRSGVVARNLQVCARRCRYRRARHQVVPGGLHGQLTTQGAAQQRECHRDRPAQPFASAAFLRDDFRHTGLRATVRDPAELELHVVRALDAVDGILRQARLHQAIECRWRHRRNLRNRRRVRRHDRRDQRRLALALEGALARRHFVEHATERPQVAARVGFLALELLGRHVLEGADDGPFGGERLRDGRRLRQRLDRCTAARRAREPDRARESEVHELGTRLRQHHVAGFQIAMHDAGAVRAIERVGDLDAELNTSASRKRALRQARRERLAFDQLHHRDSPSRLRGRRRRACRCAGG